MPDEELKNKAEEYVKRTVCENCNKCQSYGYIGCDIYKYSKNSYIAGAKENGVIWYDLRRSPNDLPKEFDVIKKAFGIYPEKKIIHIVLNQDGEYVHCSQGDWYYIYDEDIVGDSPRADVIAWCEIPKFKVEE